ncbi:ABC transporter permease subunit [Kitasatospora atroaurantiaca]|uniref:ABC-2 family transporter n=1 Tax=Kitasatospora atroaurantiaca TaxID=285545 RepID=A0A561F1L6_9ACTN|nr:ABC transporter permease subunit [Kitasatospora atroaurantiaca]TWE21753.1 ABC-2 family transporter [Kitasatospora atroaurantiaca]
MLTPTAPPREASPVFASPIPVEEARLGHALASEWTKIRSVRSTVWNLAAMFTFILGVGALAVVFSDGTVQPGDDILGLGMGGFFIGQIPVIALGVLTISSEYGTGMIRSTLTACPRRARMLTAKALVFFALVLVLATAAIGTFTAVAIAMLGDEAGPQPTEQVLRTVVGGSLYLAAIGLMSLAMGALLRHSAGAISAMLGFVMLPTIIGLFTGEAVGRYLILYAPVSISAALFGNGLDPDVNPWQLLGALVALAAALLAVAYPVVSRRDV